VLAHSLSHFQLGETGEGKFLLAHARREAPDDPAYHEALRLFIAEESEHARILERLVRRFGGRTIQRHWTQSLFHLVRHAIGFKFEIQLLLIAEIVGTAYYRLLLVRSRDSVLEEVCSILLKDEAQHVDFHADWLGEFQSRLLPLERSAWNAQFQLLFAAAAQVAWFDHKQALFAIGARRREFFREARRECIRFLSRLEENAARIARAACSMPAMS
jgi:rubrerythrin